MKHLLVPSDFSFEAEVAFEFALTLARRFDSKVTVLNVLDVSGMPESFTDVSSRADHQIYQRSEHSARENYATFFRKHGNGHQNIDLVFKSGPVATTITQYAAENGIDLIIMGTKGATGLKEFFIGSNTEKVVRFASVPVLAMKNPTKTDSIKTIVYPTSLEFNQTEFVDKLKNLQAMYGARLHLLYINTPYCFMDETDMEEFIKFYGLTDVSYSLRNSPVEANGILSYVKEHHPDLLVMPTHARKGLSHLFSGSIAEQVVNRLICPIWTYVLKETNDPEIKKREENASLERKQRHHAEQEL